MTNATDQRREIETRTLEVIEEIESMLDDAAALGLPTKAQALVNILCNAVCRDNVRLSALFRRQGIEHRLAGRIQQACDAEDMADKKMALARLSITGRTQR